MPRLPFPLTTGRKISLYHYCRILSKNLGYRLIVAAFLESGDDAQNKPDFIDKLIVLKNPSALEKIKNLFLKSVLFRKQPMQVSLYWSNEAKKQIEELIKTEKPDIAIADMIRCTEYIKNFIGLKIADLDDMLSLRYKRQLESDMANINPYGRFVLNFSAPIKKFLLWQPLKLWITKNEVKLLKKYERDIAGKFDTTVFVAQKECDIVNAELGRKAAVAIPIGVDSDYFTRKNPLPDNHVIGFMGAMDVTHNEQAVIYFVNEIFPKIKQKVPDAEFLCIGGGVGEKLTALKNDAVRFTGWVDDIREHLAKCRVFVCPMTFGSGIKTKILEAASYGIPVVTTPIGAENIDGVDKRDWLVVDGSVAFADCVAGLLNDYEAAKAMGENGSRFVREWFSWNVAQRGFEGILSRTENYTSFDKGEE
jgi:glycosyltransferase involved in cell wall biosynthesis